MQTYVQLSNYTGASTCRIKLKAQSKENLEKKLHGFSNKPNNVVALSLHAFISNMIDVRDETCTS